MVWCSDMRRLLSRVDMLAWVYTTRPLWEILHVTLIVKINLQMWNLNSFSQIRVLCVVDMMQQILYILLKKMFPSGGYPILA